jgi:hypothetical protein
MTDEARRYAVPWPEIVRHGFHGLAVESVVEQISAPRLVVCHLGGGCSVTAVRDCRSLDTTMGLTPLEGVPIVTRSGSLDPGALLYLLRRGRTVDELDHALNEESGLTALGGLDEPSVVAYFAYHVAKAVAAMAAVLGGVDAVAFSGGIGENRCGRPGGSGGARRLAPRRARARRAGARGAGDRPARSPKPLAVRSADELAHTGLVTDRVEVRVAAGHVAEARVRLDRRAQVPEGVLRVPGEALHAGEVVQRPAVLRVRLDRLAAVGDPPS